MTAHTDTASDRALLTSWSASKAHLDSGKEVRHLNAIAPMTVCGRPGTRAGDRTALGPLEQEAIDSMPMCGQCARRKQVTT